MFDHICAILPLIPSILLLLQISNIQDSWIVFISVSISIAGYWLTTKLIPVIAQYTLKGGLSGKDLGKKGTPRANFDVPEALGIVTGTVFLMCTIITQVFFVKQVDYLTISNSALFSVCFMIFLGFVDDTVDLKWRFKLILPTLASLPLLVTYSGFTSVYIPTQLRSLLWDNTNNSLTGFGSLLDIIFTVDKQAEGGLVELSYWFMLFMGLLAVFCTNAINIFAGINGLETGQSYVIGCSILFFKLYEFLHGETSFDHLFSIIMILPFIGTSLGLLTHNWYPASVFVGDTYCYFAGMTFAVVGIHGHFSKTLLILLFPQIINFLYSIPQLFKVIPCPRHRLPRFNPATNLMTYSAFPCASHEYIGWKVSPDAEEVPNCTLICLVLRICGPMSEKNLCLSLLLIQIANSIVVFYIRYVLLEQ